MDVKGEKEPSFGGPKMNRKIEINEFCHGA
jgi:hypothetical protein